MREAVRRHAVRMHARIAGALAVLALFFATTVPWSVRRALDGEWSLSMVAYVALFAIMGFSAWRQACRWHALRPTGQI